MEVYSSMGAPTLGHIRDKATGHADKLHRYAIIAQ